VTTAFFALKRASSLNKKPIFAEKNVEYRTLEFCQVPIDPVFGLHQMRKWGRFGLEAEENGR
jgi:hypothetical protein